MQGFKKAESRSVDKRLDKRLVAYLLFYSVLVLVLAGTMDLSISNSYQRAGAALFVANYVTHDFWRDLSSENSSSGNSSSTVFSTIKTRFLTGYQQYNIFSGLADWPPLQFMLLTLSFLIFGTNWFAYTLPSLVMTLVGLVFLYKLTRHLYSRSASSKTAKNVGLLAVVFASLSTYVLWESGAPLLENTLAAFMLMSTYFFILYLDTDKNKYLYWCSACFGLGLLTKYEVLLLGLPFAFFFVTKHVRSWRKKQAGVSAWNTVLKPVFVSTLVFLAVLSPLIAREVLFVQEGVSTLVSRSVGRLEYVADTSAGVSGYLLASDLEFENALPSEKHALIKNRYSLSYDQKFVIVFTSLFFNWILLPLLFAGLLFGRLFDRLSGRNVWNAFTRSELVLLSACVVYVVMLGFHGLLPRYMIPTGMFLTVFAARGITQLPKNIGRISFIIVVGFLLAQDGSFFGKISNGEHIQAMQHDYDATAQYLLNHQNGTFTVLTTRQYETAFFLQEHDVQQRAFIQLLPEKKQDAEALLTGRPRTSALLEATQIRLPVQQPPVKYLVVHELLETGPLKGLADYNLLDFAKEHGTLETIIPSRHPNSRTWVFRIFQTS